MMSRILRSIHNTAVKFAVGLLAVGTLYLGGAALLASTIAAHVFVAPVVASYMPEPTDVRIFILLWLAVASATLMIFGSILARPTDWLLNKLDNIQARLSFA